MPVSEGILLQRASGLYQDPLESEARGDRRVCPELVALTVSPVLEDPADLEASAARGERQDSPERQGPMDNQDPEVKQDLSAQQDPPVNLASLENKDLLDQEAEQENRENADHLDNLVCVKTTASMDVNELQ